MKLLILTQVLDKEDEVLGFFHTWVSALAKKCEQVTVIALRVGSYDLPNNVRVLSLGKEGGASRVKYLRRFFSLIISERKNYDTVLVHMNAIYIVLGGLFWKLMGKKVGLWYAHGHVPFTLRIAMLFMDRVFTSTKSGFRIASEKVHVIGQGIDTERFPLQRHEHKQGEPFHLIVVGRISPVKDYETTIRALEKVRAEKLDIVLDIIGGAGLPEQEAYLMELKNLVEQLHLKESVVFHGGLPNTQIAELLSRAHCFVNSSRTGSFDKAVGEGMATGLPILTSNEAFREVLGKDAAELMFTPGDDKQLTSLISKIYKRSDEERNNLGRSLATLIQENHSLNQFIHKLLSKY